MKATIIGVGNLGGAIARGLANGTFMRAEDITCVDTNPEALERLRETGLPFKLTTDVRKAVPDTDIFILAVKPHAVPIINEQCRDLLDFDKHIFFSVVAGITFDDFDKMMFGDPRATKDVHFRIMPNLAIEMGESMTFISSRNANDAQIKLAETIFGEMGRTMVIPEQLMSAATAVGSCGIAYVMRYMSAAMNGAIEAGFSQSEALAIILQTMKGAIDLLSTTGQHPEAEISRVLTPGGYTIRGLNKMEEKGFSNAIIAGIRESCRPSSR
ncbi:MAG: pyrroline-5-carboxylate reductase [Alistipes sp.]|jgi:pyrroline-5-carboxylate reductase|nr:pyrroline-5-carboxylate reductase [Alistipes sp.]